MDTSIRGAAVAAGAVLLIVGSLGLGCGCREAPAGGAVTTLAVTQGTAAGYLGGLGDEYLPQAGNSGYDVLHYDITLECDPLDGSLAGTTVIEAEASMELREFHLDLLGLKIEEASLDGLPVDYRRQGQELIVECAEPIAAGSSFTVAVRYSGTPGSMTSADGYRVGWQHSGETIFTLDEPEGAATWYPLNDHPSDKATYSFRLTVPSSYTAVANGLLAGIESEDGRRTFAWEMTRPMANYLASVVVGELVLQETESPAGVPIRNYFTPEVAETASSVFAQTGEMLDYFSSIFGPYPFEVYGAIVPDATTQGSAMENQTIALFGRDTFEDSMVESRFGEMVIAHELAHEWFGNSVTPERWRDVWLNEGFATYASWLWFEHKLGVKGMEMWVEYAYESLPEVDASPPGDPGVEALFNVSVYERGGLTLHALRRAIGDERFFTVLRRWAEENAYGNVGTEEFIELVQEEISGLGGFDADDFFETWLYEPELPPASQVGL